MKANPFKAGVIKAGIAASILFLLSGVAMAQSAVTLSAGAQSTTLPDGQAVPMWGYTCGVVTGTGVSCTAMDGNPQSGGMTWQPPLITVPSGQPLTITLINNLGFPTSGDTNNIPTSLIVVGQFGGGLGAPQMMPSPEHAPQGTTWPGTPGTADASNCLPGQYSPDKATFCPPKQLPRVRSFGTEVPTGPTGVALTWSNLRPGTYYIGSGTEPSIQGPMGLYGVLVVTDDANLYPYTALPAGAAAPFDSDVALLLSEIDPVQNAAVDQAVRTAGFSDALVWNGQTGQCGDPAVHTCYPPAVNYTPLYFLLNGKSFDRAHPENSVLAVPGAGAEGRVMLRFVNAGSRMHVPTISGLNMALHAEDGNILPGLPKVQSELFLPAGKTQDVMISPKPDTTAADTYLAASYALFDRALALSTYNQRDGGMQAFLRVNNGTLPTAAAVSASDKAYFCVAGVTLNVTDPSKGLLAGTTGANGVVLGATFSGDVNATNLVVLSNGTFKYSQSPSATSCGGTFEFLVNGSLVQTATITQCDVSTPSCAALSGAPTANADAYSSNVASRLQITPPGVLENDEDPGGLPLKVDLASVTPSAGLTVSANADGSFSATAAAPGTYSFTYMAKNAQNVPSTGAATVTLTFPEPSNLAVHVLDGKDPALELTDYRWIIEEDRTVYIDPTIETTGSGGGAVQNVAVNFHTSHTPIVAQGCVGPVSCEEGQTVLDPSTGMHLAAVCDVGNGACRPGTQKTEVSPSQVYLDPTKRYYISILPGDGSNPIIEGTTVGVEGVGHTMGGAQIAAGQTAVNVYVQKTPLEPAQISVFVFQDDHPLNGEHDGGGGTDIIAPNEAGLGGFNIVLLDQAGQLGDSAGQITYDMFNEPVTNALAGKIDPTTGLNACPIAKNTDGNLVGQIVTCPKYEEDGVTLSPLAGHAIINNLYAGLYEVVATPAADRIARGEEWLQTNTLDGTKPIEAFIKPGEPAYFQEFGPGGYHVAVGFANSAIINARKGTNGDGKGLVCSNQPCNSTIYGKVTALRMSRTPDQRVYSSGSYDSYAFAQCYVSLGAPDSADFAFAKCNPDGTFTFDHVPQGNMKVTVFDQWNDLLVDGLSTPIKVDGDTIGSPEQPLEIPVTQWRTDLYGRVFVDSGECSDENGPGVAGDGVSQSCEPGVPLTPYNIRMRDGSYFGFNNTDLNGYAGFNEVFPILNWLVIDIDNANYKLSKIHVVYDAGGPVDGTFGGGGSSIAAGFANTIESPTAHVPNELRVPGARYCAFADCPPSDTGFDPTPTGYDSDGNPTGGNPGSTGRVDPGWVTSEGWQGLLGQNSFIEFAMKPFAQGENGGVKGFVNYASTRPFDDPGLMLQLSWQPGIPDVKINLYKEDTASDGTTALTLVDTTYTASWDEWAQGFRRNADGSLVLGPDAKPVPNMSCPGQETTSPFYFTLKDSKMPLDPATELSFDSRFKCYDGWSMLNQVQPAPYNGLYKFPSIVNRDTTTGAPIGTGTGVSDAGGSMPGTNCTICIPNDKVPPTDNDYGAPMLPPGNYVVEVVVPQGYELMKEEDKNILLGDAYVAPVSQQFAGFGNIFILPDQAEINAFYNPNNTLQATANNGALPRHEGDTGSVETFWPCVGQLRIVPDLNSLYPYAGQAAPFAGASRRLCDRKEVVVKDQMTSLVKFYLFSSAHIAGHFTGTITNDFASEFDPFSPQFGEKFAVPNTPVALRDFTGKEISRVYSDQWGVYNGMTFSSYTVNPPSPSGYIPQMMIMCMNDPGPIKDTRVGSPTFGQMITDPGYNPAYSNFCYEWPFMPGQTSYLDTPVVPTMAFADRYNLPDCEFPDTTPAIKTVTGDPIPNSTGSGPWVSSGVGNHPLTINALGDKQVINHAYSGPRASDEPFNEKFVTRHYGFGSCTGLTGGNSFCTNGAMVSIGGVNVPISSWSDMQIIANVNPAVISSMPLCNASNPTYTGDNAGARCGELVITAANGKSSIDTVTVTVGGRAPTYVTPESPSSDLFGKIVASPLQTAIDNAAPGDLIIVGPGTYKENLIMWKPVRLQGVGAESVIINADAHPAGKFDAWRRQVDCLFGLTLEGRPSTEGPFDPSGTYECPASMFNKVDRNNREGIIGWDATTNGNLAQQLQEPTLMGAYEGAGITALGKGVRYPAGEDPYALANAGAFPAGTEYLTTAQCSEVPGSGPAAFDQFDHATSNYLCNPSRIDGLSVINSSQGGGGIFLHGWNHHTQVSNNYVHSNHGTLTGGITVGASEFTAPYINGGADPVPFPIPAGTPDGLQLGYGMNTYVNVHHNAVTGNASIGDALYSTTPSGGGGVTFCTGSDYYNFNYNWVCGNLSAGDGGGVAHLGFTNDGTIAHNWILFNQSQSPTIPVNGGGLAILGASPDRTFTTGPNAGQECGTTTDQDCPPGLPEGTGRHLVIDANLIMGNGAESGTGGGLRLQMVNGDDVVAFPLDPTLWNDVTVTNNIVADNVAGWDGGGVSLQDALRVKFVNNTVISNDTTASAGVLFNTLGATTAAVPPPGCTPPTDPNDPLPPECVNPVTTSTYQAAGLVTMHNTPNMDAAIPATINCPIGNSSGAGATTSVPNGDCRTISYPLLANNLFWKNRAFHIEVGDLGSGELSQQKVVTLVPSLNQTSTGFCASVGTDVGAPHSADPVNYWDIGVRGDTGPTDHGSGFTLAPTNSILSATGADYAGSGNYIGSDPLVVSLYCNGSRLPPEGGGLFAGFNAPPGRSETTGLYPVFALNQITPAATVDEGNNWINLGWGPYSLGNAALYAGPGIMLAALGDYAITAGSPAIDNASPTGAPNHDFLGRPRPQGGGFDIGAVELGASVTPHVLAFGDVQIGLNNSQAPTMTLTLSNTGGVTLTDISVGTFPDGFSRVGGGSGNCGTSLNAGQTCTITVRFQPTTLGSYGGSLTISASVPVAGSPVQLSGNGVAP